MSLSNPDGTAQLRQMRDSLSETIAQFMDQERIQAQKWFNNKHIFN
jgi:hypothetical protein